MPDLFRELYGHASAMDSNAQQFTTLMDALAAHPVAGGVNVHERPPLVGPKLYYGMMAPEAYWAGGGGNAANAEAVPFGSLGDPVSQLAFAGAPALQRAFTGFMRPSPGQLSGNFLRNERGAVGGESSYDALRRETLARSGGPTNIGTPDPKLASTLARPEHEWRYSAEGIQRMRDALGSVEAPVHDIFRVGHAIPGEAQQALVVLGNGVGRGVPMRWGADPYFAQELGANGIKQYLQTYLQVQMASPRAALKAGYIAQSETFGRGYYDLTPKFFQDAVGKIVREVTK